MAHMEAGWRTGEYPVEMNPRRSEAVVAGMNQRGTKPYEHAVVLGASMAGLVTAQALSRHFRRVTIVERDELADRPAGRPGVPQADHLHVLLPGGMVALEALLPGYATGLRDAGAESLVAPTELLWLNPAGWINRFAPQHEILSASRQLIEWHTRRLVTDTPGVVVRDGLSVLDLRMAESGERVAGIRCEKRSTDGGSDDGAFVDIDADLVVDATGRRSRLPDWLERAGHERPAETRIDAHLGYATRIFRRPEGDRDWKAVFIQSQPPATNRMGVMFPIEGDRWIVTVQGVAEDRPPAHDDDFLDFAARLRSTAIYDAIRDAEPLTPVVTFANTANRRRHYDGLPRWPERLLAVGDSACAFNPVYGQGMSVAAKSAVALDGELERHGRSHDSLDGFVRRMQRRIATEGNAAWMIATGDDLRMPTTTGAKVTAATRMQHRYLDRVVAASTTDETVLSAMLNVFFLLASPTSLFRPSIVRRALRRRTIATPSDAPAVSVPVTVRAI
jgi:2-polyprenyl-6-methoxyphenol hydroxylase-like FAD-dependent oxidoreductase